MQGGSQPQLPMAAALQRSEEDSMRIVRRFRQIKKVDRSRRCRHPLGDLIWIGLPG